MLECRLVLLVFYYWRNNGALQYQVVVPRSYVASGKASYPGNR